ncbi:GNAT family N-acetyltransferase [Lacrimispora algidixylanolytica]|uniref:GNAT family N-acetyltransferase n=1 Tax=Lacrimispora algidixylanolytica TaxID=94868 RepID=UPI0026C592D5
MEYREINISELNKELFQQFNRYQEVKECVRKVNGVWSSVKNPFTEQWQDEDYEVLVRCLKITIHTGGVVFGAFHHGELKGFASVEGVFMGKHKNYLDLSNIHVSYDVRGKRTGRRLFHMVSEWARLKGAQNLYISAQSSVETQAFYKAMGCMEAKEYDEAHVTREPHDCQLEYKLERKVILYIGISLDGYIADEKGKVDWLMGQDPSYEGDYGYETFSKQVDTVLMGYNTYHQVVTELSPDEWVYPDKETYVITHKELKDKPRIYFTGESLESLLGKLKKQTGKGIWICGGAELVSGLMEKSLIDEYHLTIMPLFLGKGIRLFREMEKEQLLKLVSMQTENGVIDCIYRKRWI